MITCVKIATALLSKILARKESMNLDTNYKIQTGISLIRPTMPMIITPLTIFLSISTLAYLMRVSLLKLSKVKLLTPSGNLGLQRAYLGQSIRKIS